MALLAGCVMPYSHENLHASKIEIGGVTLSLASVGGAIKRAIQWVLQRSIYEAAF